jgi:hypothetical protein
MALSNWDTLAFNSKGKSSRGYATNKSGNSIEIYKSQVHIHSSSMWKYSTGFVEPIIAQILQGDLNLAGFEIISVRGPQNGIFVFTYYDDKYFAGIGCYGFDRYGKWVGVQPKTLEKFFVFLDKQVRNFRGGPDLEA